jgi:hypothetical protein
MTFLTPWLGILAGAIALPTLLILYFLKLRRRDIEISTTLLWKKAIQDLQANAPFQKLRRNLLLFLQILILLGACFALAQPRLKAQVLQTQRHIILIDRSGSMTARDGGQSTGEPISRLEEAKTQAEATIDSLREGGVLSRGVSDEAMIIAFGTNAEVLQPFTSDKATLKAALKAIQPIDGPTRIDEAVRLAKAHRPTRTLQDSTTGQAVAVEGLVGGDPVTIHLFTDGRIPDAPQAKMTVEGDSLIYHRLGRIDAPNVGVVAIRSDRAFENPDRLNVFVGIENNEPQPRGVDVELLIDGVVAGIKSTSIPAAKIIREEATNPDGTPVTSNASTDADTPAATPAATTRVADIQPGVGGVVFPIDRSESALVSVRLRGVGTGEALEGDVLPLDDAAWLVVPPAKRLSIAFVTNGNEYLRAALEGYPLARLQEWTPAQYEEATRSGRVAEFDVVVLDGVLPAGAPDANTGLPPGRFVIFGAVPPPESGIVDKGKGGPAGMVDWSRDHPALRGLALDSVVIVKSRNVEVTPRSPATVLASADTGPAVIEVAAAQTRAIVVPFDIQESYWPFDASFVVFVGRAIRHVGDDGAQGGTLRSIQPGRVLSDRLPSDATNVRIEGPGGVDAPITTAPDGSFVFGPVERVGVYRVRWNGSPGAMDAVISGRNVRTYAANLGDSQESQVAATEQIDVAEQQVAATGGSREGTRNLWPWLLLAAMGVMLLEWYIFNRKVYV